MTRRQEPDLLIQNAIKILGLTEEEAQRIPRRELKAALFAYAYGAGSTPGLVFSPSDPAPTHTLRELVDSIDRGTRKG